MNRLHLSKYSGLRRKSDNLRYPLLRDEFLDDRAVGAINQTLATDGVSQRYVQDPKGGLSISGGKLQQIVVTTSANDYETLIEFPPILRSPAKIMIARIQPCVGASYRRGPSYIGFSNLFGANSSSVEHSFSFIAWSALAGGVRIDGPDPNNQQVYDLAIILDAVGARYYIKGTPWTNWTLAKTDTTQTSSILYPFWSSGLNDNRNTAYFDLVRIYRYLGGDPQAYFDLPTTTSVNRKSVSILYYGDSKTAPANKLSYRMTAENFGAFDYPTAIGHAGYTVTQLAGSVATDLAAVAGTPDIISFGAGANGIGVEVEADFRTNYQVIVDACKAKWPSAKFYGERVWTRGATAGAIATRNASINTVLDANPGYCFRGSDESIWMEGGDNGATYTSDGTHYSDPTGLNECARQRRIAFGY